jgi:cytochrome c biogenesis protein CcdA
VSQTRPESPHSLGELVGGLAGDIQDLVRGEIALARSELDQKLQRVILAAIWLVGGALVGFAGLVVVLQGVSAALALVIPTWAAALIVGMIIIVVGGLFARSGLRMLSLRTLAPDRTAQSLQKDARMVREHT